MHSLIFSTQLRILLLSKSTYSLIVTNLMFLVEIISVFNENKVFSFINVLNFCVFKEITFLLNFICYVYYSVYLMYRNKL